MIIGHINWFLNYTYIKHKNDTITTRALLFGSVGPLHSMNYTKRQLSHTYHSIEILTITSVIITANNNNNNKDSDPCSLVYNNYDSVRFKKKLILT